MTGQEESEATESHPMFSNFWTLLRTLQKKSKGFVCLFMFVWLFYFLTTVTSL